MTSTQLAWLIRRHGIEMTHLSGGSHIGAVLSVADILGVLYAGILHYDSQNPNWDGRDRLIMSKGHAGAAVYAALAESGFFDPAELKTHYANGSRLSGHVSHHLPGVDFSTGSLGHGLSAAAGMALAAKQDGKHHRVFAVLGDGECDEGAVWEAALFANHYRLENLVAVIDHNHMQSLDTCENTLELEDFGAKWRAFGWHVVTVDGVPLEDPVITYTYQKKGGLFGLGGSSSREVPTEPGEYTQTAVVGGNYSAQNISRTFVIAEPALLPAS